MDANNQSLLVAMSHAWTPVITDELADQGRLILSSVSRSLEQILAPNTFDPGGDRALRSAGHFALANGMSAVTMYGAAVSDYDSLFAIRDCARIALLRSLGAIGEIPMSPGLFTGFSGISWAARTTRRPREQVDLSEIDSAIASYVARRSCKSYDLIAGIVGIGVYCLSIEDSTTRRLAVTAVVDILHALAREAPGGIAWLSRPASEWEQTRFSDHYYNLGLAHGIPGIIGLLARIVTSDITDANAALLLEKSTSWLLAQRLPEMAQSCFPSTISHPAGIPTPSRLAWCYGDVGIALALLSAARAMGCTDWEREALRIAVAAARREVTTSGVLDPWFCHGAAGVAHMFNRLFQATGEQRLATAARVYYARSFQTATPIIESLVVGGEVPDTIVGLLDGFSGLGLAIVAALDSQPPTWDRIFLVDCDLKAVG